MGKGARVKVLSLLLAIAILSFASLSYLNKDKVSFALPTGYKKTSALTDSDKADNNQKNYQSSDKNNFVKMAEWTNKDKGEAKITLTYSLPEDEIVKRESRAVYLYGGCEYHGFSRAIAKKQVRELLAVYDIVDVYGTYVADTNDYSKYFTSFKKGDTNLELEVGTFYDSGRHDSGWLILPYLSEYLKTNDPDVIVVAYDGNMATPVYTRSYPSGTIDDFFTCDNLNTENGNKEITYTTKAKELLSKIAKYQEDGRYFVTIPQDQSHYNTISQNTVCNNVKDKAAFFMLTAPWYLNAHEQYIVSPTATNLTSEFLPQGQKIYSYGDSLGAQEVEYPPPTHDIVITDTISSAFTVGDKSTITSTREGIKAGTVTVSGQKVTVSYKKLEGGQELKVEIPVTLKEASFRNAENGFEVTNSGNATIKVDARSLSISSPKLYKLSKGNVIVHHYKEGTTEKIEDDVIIKDIAYGDDYTTTDVLKTHPEYDLVGKPTNATGKLDKDIVEVTYYYKIKKGTVTAEYKEVETGTVLDDPVTKTYDYKTEYTTEKSTKITPDYDLIDISKPEKGEVNTPSLTVVYTYKKKDPKIEDTLEKTGTEILKNKEEKVEYKINYNATLTDYIGPYKLTVIDNLPYEIDETKSNIAEGVYNKENKTITWTLEESINSYENNKVSFEKNIEVYFVNIDLTKRTVENKVSTKFEFGEKTEEEVATHHLKTEFPGVVIVKYVDMEGNEIAEKIEKIGLVGESYESKAKDINGYELKDKPEKEVVEFPEGILELVYKYEKVLPVEVPDTSSLVSIGGIFIGMVLMMASGMLIITRFRRV